ncbi:MAG TPA: DUF3455 domain-containing protein [Vicinamibacterales bacterium]|nr:DUF3455 domain-containing protein [Vicinamibacterales bacterium]
MTHHSFFASGLILVALALPVAASAQHGGRIEVPAVPGNLVVDEGNVPYLQTRGYGTQNYVCLPSATGVAWKLFGPQATLYPLHSPLQVATHFLSPNPEEQGLPRATWQDAHDGSAVWARAIQPSTDADYVAPGAIPWLLLEKKGTAPGPTGGSMLAQTTFIHRVNTEGGIAPATGCSNTAQLGAIALVPYSTDYIFYRAESRR